MNMPTDVQNDPSQKFGGGTLVIKLGGVQGLNYSHICQDALQWIDTGVQVVFVHGGSNEANSLGEAVGYPPRFVTSVSGYTSRYTDRRTREIFMMAVNGKVNSMLVEELQKLGVRAFGMSGADGRLIEARRKATIRIVENGRRKVLRDDYTGKIIKVNMELLNTLMGAGYIPVIAPLATSETGESLNVDADRVAASVAAALGAETLLLLTAAPGLLRNYPDESSRIPSLPAGQLGAALEFAEDRMKKKVLGAKEALEGGVRRVIIADGRSAEPITAAFAGKGTFITGA